MTERKKTINCGPAGGGIYGLAFIGSAVYYLGQASSFISGLIGFLKALVWPAFLVYEALKYLGA